MRGFSTGGTSARSQISTRCVKISTKLEPAISEGIVDLALQEITKVLVRGLKSVVILRQYVVSFRFRTESDWKDTVYESVDFILDCDSLPGLQPCSDGAIGVFSGTDG